MWNRSNRTIGWQQRSPPNLSFRLPYLRQPLLAFLDSRTTAWTFGTVRRWRGRRRPVTVALTAASASATLRIHGRSRQRLLGRFLGRATIRHRLGSGSRSLSLLVRRWRCGPTATGQSNSIGHLIATICLTIDTTGGCIRRLGTCRWRRWHIWRQRSRQWPALWLRTAQWRLSTRRGGWRTRAPRRFLARFTTCRLLRRGLAAALAFTRRRRLFAAVAGGRVAGTRTRSLFGATTAAAARTWTAAAPTGRLLDGMRTVTASAPRILLGGRRRRRTPVRRRLAAGRAAATTIRRFGTRSVTSSQRWPGTRQNQDGKY